ncbi:hypothetical protein [Endozoicomonas sp. YOMI1]|uniref:hypothetical protein n=1 Tax=Endozoicomonas sp. YOMI1 TaxID=2828739 RepID=UPI0021484331|nr:hypothetical protein [Endozoicomonas sp. YOMI1]
MGINKIQGGVNHNNCGNTETRKIGKTEDQRKATPHSANRNLQSGIKPVEKGLSNYKISSSATNKTKVKSTHANTAGAKVVKAANKMVGRYQWGPPAMNEHKAANGLEELVKRGTPISEESRLNCWESILQAGMKSGMLPEDKLVRWMRDNGALDADFVYQEKITKLLGMKDSIPLQDTTPEPGDIILFYGSSHVALSTGGDGMLHLPSHSMFKEGSVKSFCDYIKADDQIYYEHLKGAANTMYTVSNCPVSEKVYEQIFDFGDAIAESEPGSPEYDEAKAATLKAVSAIENQMEVRIIKNPWGKMLDLIEKTS